MTSVNEYDTFKSHVDKESREELERSLGYRDGGLKIEKDWAVRFFKSKDQDGNPIYFIRHSAIEFIFSHKGQGCPSGYYPFAKGGEVELLAPNGKPTNLTPEQYRLTRSDAFLRFFGNFLTDPKNASKVVDSNGDPLVCYHGSPHKFNVFNYDKIGSQGTSEGFGFYFTSAKDIASGYATKRSVDGSLFEVFLNIRKPFSDTKKTISKKEIRDILLFLYKKDEYALSNYGDVEYAGVNSVLNEAVEIESASETDTQFVGSLINGGIAPIEEVLNAVRTVTGKDGVFTSWESDTKNVPLYICIEPNQIKLSDGTNTTFDPKSPDVRFEKGGSITPREKHSYEKWKKLVNMSASELQKFYDSEEGKEAGLSEAEAKEHGIHYGRESARWIIKMKKTPVSEWTSEMWDWANRQISFISRMKNAHGKLFDEHGKKTRKHTSLLIWGHNPEKFSHGGALQKNDSENSKNETESLINYKLEEILAHFSKLTNINASRLDDKEKRLQKIPENKEFKIEEKLDPQTTLINHFSPQEFMEIASEYGYKK